MFAKMLSGRKVMTGLDDIAMELSIVRDVDFSLTINESIMLLLFKNAVYKLTKSFGFERLECLSYRRFTIETVLNVLFKQWHRNFG
jgi:hypothetical protein